MDSTSTAAGRELPSTLLGAVRYFSDVDVATSFFAEMRWPDGPICPRCECREYSYLKTRRLWKCRACKYQYSVKVGSIFEDSAIPLTKWLPATWFIANCRNGISSHELGRSIGVCQKTAWFMLQRIRLAMQTGSFEKYADKFDGAVEVDETYIGGKARHMHAHKRKALKARERSQGHFGKTGVVGFLQRGGKVHLTVIESTKRPELQREVRRVVRPGATIYTDELRSYRGLDQHYVHNVINHAEAYVDGHIHTNGLENFWSLLKRGISGTYISVRPFHLFRYLDEQVYRFNHREGEDKDRFAGILANAPGRRLTWNELTARSLPAPKPDPRPVSRHRMGPF